MPENPTQRTVLAWKMAAARKEKPALTASEIGKIGVRILVTILRHTCQNVKPGIRLPGATGIEADGNGVGYLVQVKMAVSPNTPADLSANEAHNITSRARLTNRTALLAKVTINSEGLRVGDIEWTKL